MSSSITKVYHLLVPKNASSASSANFYWNDTFRLLAAGIVCGVSSLAAGYAIGEVGYFGVKSNAEQEAVFVGMVLILIFGEAIGLYGMIVAIILTM